MYIYIYIYRWSERAGIMKFGGQKELGRLNLWVKSGENIFITDVWEFPLQGDTTYSLCTHIILC